MRRKRLLLGLALAAALAPSLWVRSELPPAPRDPAAAITAVQTGSARAGPLELVGAWEITGRGRHFGGFSALLALPGGRLLAGTDGANKLVFQRPDREVRTPPRFTRFGAEDDADKLAYDLESLAYDPVAGIIWGGYEGSNAIRRFGRDLQPQTFVSIPEMQDWGENSGPEAMVRMGDGRFLVIEEDRLRWSRNSHRALLFDDDPLKAKRPARLRIEVPYDYSPVDMSPLGTDRVVVLLRDFSVGLPLRFRTAIAVLDTADLAEGKVVELELVTELGDDFPQDNYEGLTLTQDADGTHLWLVSDDNLMSYQHSYLLKLRWDEAATPQRKKARE
ncbi:esterase-like activity of phytase family protein [Qipengyuania sp. XHP0207]|uniref:esterase-like activity of phytase family protein n=1 Tax=Qipengyuania sp. XHP0207 TaxID=3038078 RepID=UPI00241C265B|nr:esterase-like activity of phytase family protein [Qipengyuania sp. XHP0207]MDG5748018.1 esterase-like activity of phytase family protein [Qipengyuania sp. XHP0207]